MFFVFLDIDSNMIYYKLDLCVLSQVVDKVKMQLDAFLEDGSHAVTNAVIRALSAAVSVKSPSLQDYIL